ncbi:tyrosine-protein phosphatase [Paenibacillus motobuensis]|uniref:tyrosine-protein phosphatase n=1 Tax=Paenibacillus TaxID=44249 RepID=UPI00203F1B29|nr:MULTISPECIES: tyrosine-protein phosphatase [Paenibacillus]MCM3039790.1 tyrosine-protein phosphatase [Paenibacillus lutimineralis]MCM3646894.1 tyrosine-protein phosphatase [Paenibacillus motobuensis]
MRTATNGLERLLKLDGAYNVRDIGGYETITGGIVQRGRLFRADGLHQLSLCDQELILELGVKTIIDLRFSDETAAKRDVFADHQEVNYYNISLVNPATTKLRDIRNLGDMYKILLDTSGPLIAEVFSRIAETKDGLLFHCSAGKDRTGVVAALLLDLAGAPRETIVSDYAETETNLAPIIDELLKDHPAEMSLEEYRAFMGSAPENMEIMLDHLYSVYGGAEQYLTTNGLRTDEIETLRHKLLQD